MITGCLIPFLMGCQAVHNYTFTGALWDDELGDRCHEAASNSQLMLSETIDKKDVLVEYDELYDKSGKITRRAFLLNGNEHKLHAGRKPHFISGNEADRIRGPGIVIITNSSLAAPDKVCAVQENAESHFTLISGGAELGRYQLPVYPDVRARAIQLTLTPAAVTGDVVVYSVLVGSVVGFIAAWAYVSGHNN